MYGYVSMCKCRQLAPTGTFHRSVIWSSCPAGQCITVNLCEILVVSECTCQNVYVKIHYDRVRSQFHLAQRALRNHLLHLALILAHSRVQEQMVNKGNN